MAEELKRVTMQHVNMFYVVLFSFNLNAGTVMQNKKRIQVSYF